MHVSQKVEDKKGLSKKNADSVHYGREGKQHWLSNLVYGLAVVHVQQLTLSESTKSYIKYI